jgi:VWFA-related protein
MRIPTTVLLIVAAALPLLASESPVTSKYRIELLGQPDSTDLKNITVRFRVVDQNGEPAKQLPDEEFRIFEDGKEVHRFRPAGLRSQPMSVVLAMDTSGSMERENRIAAAQRAANRFFDKLDERTPCGLVLFHHETWQREPLHAEKERLRHLVNAARPAGGTAYLNATYDAIELLAGAENKDRRAVVLMTDGRDVNSKRNLDDVVKQANRLNVRVYTLGLGKPGQQRPVRTVMVLDRSGSMADRGKMDALKKAARRYVGLLPPELADSTIIAFNDRVPMAGPFTSSRERLRKEIDQLIPSGGTALFDAIYEAVETLSAARDMDERKPLRYLVVLSDGKDENSRLSAADAIRRAVTEEIRVHLMGLGSGSDIDEPTLKKIARATGGEYYAVPDADRLTEVFEQLSINLHDDGVDEASLRRLAERTGGEYYHVQDAEKLTSIFERVAVQLENTYAVTFPSGRVRHDGTARQIDIRFGDLAGVTREYTTHGLITPVGDHQLYLGLLVLVGACVLIPSLLRRRPKMAS